MPKHFRKLISFIGIYGDVYQVYDILPPPDFLKHASLHDGRHLYDLRAYIRETDLNLFTYSLYIAQHGRI